VQNNLSALSLNIFSIGSLDAYLNAIHSISELSKEEEITLANKLKNDNDLMAAQELILSQLKFVAKIAKGYNGYGLDQADLIQEGNIGLMKAVKRFDPSHGVRLISFAVHWIKAEIYEFVLKNWRTVKIATTKAQRKLFFNLRKNKKNLDYLTDKEATKIAKNLNVSKKDVFDMENRLSSKDKTFDTANNSDDDNFSPDLYLEDNNSNFSKKIEKENQEEEHIRLLNNAINTLSFRDKDIIQSRWINNEKSTLSELAKKYGVSAERIRQIENSIFKKIRHLC
jgi:RNA polymerase sigma-32 factor